MHIVVVVSHDCLTKEDYFLEEWDSENTKDTYSSKFKLHWWIDVKQGDKLISIAMRHKGFTLSKKDLSLILGHRSYVTRS